mmetsp:Transcript_30150/g.37164  ORF Transcript_30150/g.37164 Transcript_30150/m.37164 type:complete len:494 (+) Transcript_30150:133-1614(+)|eukprot:CAMPEP_0204828248 /NCGR_PEP_ID=MMETSP1346-20131115/5911_1 /ASSEMBLY_ACC=CAM_ASM_000771 /TAXON_ID=215587 /ORGANISM="Aplanochytrium stocchinoi, Strain GSBS06" /LENGTH=493 /DNA_ID=CAMNT_0051957155 /DNA_START=66 /DNA_END=1547 /DNA_ORIENTATION=+
MAGVSGIDEDLIEAILPEAVAWSTAHGLNMVAAESDKRFIHAPMGLLPSHYPKESFRSGVALSQAYNKLVDKIARNEDWLFQTLDQVSKGDDFTNRLVELCKEVKERGVSQPWYLGIHRSDYMLDDLGDDKFALLQVELNTIASSFGCLSARVAKMHKFLLSRFAQDLPSLRQRYGLSAESETAASQLSSSLPENEADKKIPEALAKAVTCWLKTSSSNTVAVLFVVQEGERNSFDQRWLEYELFETHGIVTLRRTLAQVAETAVNKDDNTLCIDGHDIAVVYFRAGYTPDDYPSEIQWKGRKTLEFSSAIKCPSISYHLVGTKKVQQKLAQSGELENFIDDPVIASEMKKTFAGLWSLQFNEQLPDEKKAQAEAMENPSRFVMKPQREGGGNNIYGDDIATALKSMSDKERAAFILMQRIFPRQMDTVLVRECTASQGKGINELGIYSTYLGNGIEEEVNEYAGYLLRTKMEGVDEGGVATGYSCLNSVFLS